ncbi:hypothetical protein GCM10025770_27690 [Viridibacterium curvum]|uniref:Uncharacterized protein n=2 Tax=Viridibacterium curvum TaxID=1101404 RepID=A0ABP9QVR2_9RHOO
MTGPAHTKFLIDRIVPTADGQDFEIYLHVRSGWLVNFLDGGRVFGSSKSKETPDSTQNNTAEDVQYKLMQSELKNYGYRRSGTSWGALFVPYKYQLSDHSFAANPSTLAYVGYSVDWFSTQRTSIVIGGGVGAITNNTGDSGTRAVWSMATGFTSTLGAEDSQFKIAYLIGYDWGAGTVTGRKNKPWIAISMGI